MLARMLHGLPVMPPPAPRDKSKEEKLLAIEVNSATSLDIERESTAAYSLTNADFRKQIAVKYAPLMDPTKTRRVKMWRANHNLQMKATGYYPNPEWKPRRHPISNQQLCLYSYQMCSSRTKRLIQAAFTLLSQQSKTQRHSAINQAEEERAFTSTLTDQGKWCFELLKQLLEEYHGPTADHRPHLKLECRC